jgi:hypothetical protein
VNEAVGGRHDRREVEVMHTIGRALDLEDSRLGVPRVPDGRRAPDR